MLVITRRKGERIMVISPEGTEIEITLVKDGKAARIGIQAPKGYKILRPLEEIKNETIFCGRQTRLQG